MASSSFLHGFSVHTAFCNDVKIHFAQAGDGPAILLLHGHPQTHIVWRKIAPDLVAAGYHVIAPDLRGYGQSDKPPSDATHRPYSKREMAKDMWQLMQSLGHHSFAVVGHDRGGRVAHRLALDYPEAITQMVVLDIAPTLTMYERTDQEFATRYFWWFFLIQPDGLPEKMIGQDPEYFLRRHIAGQVKIPGSVTDEIIAEYLKSYEKPETIHAICEDYRASSTIDLAHDKEDRQMKIKAPLLALWGAQSVVGDLYDVTTIWQEKAEKVTGYALPCGHAIPEEAPELMRDHILAFLKDEIDVFTR